MKRTNIDEETEVLRQSILTTKALQQKEKYCIRDFSEEVYELTPEMMVEDTHFDKEEQKRLEGIAECVLHKYSKILSFQH